MEDVSRRRLMIVRIVKTVVIVSMPFISYIMAQMKNPLILSLNNVFMGIFFFYLGHYWHLLQKKVPNKYLILISLVLIAVFIAGNKMWHGEYDMSLNKWVQNPWGAGINTMCALVGISGLLLAIPMKRVPVIGFMGEHSMVFFVLHYIIIYIYKFVRAINHHSLSHHWDDFIILMVLILCICSWLVPLIEKYAFLSGRFKKRVVKE